MRIVTAIVFSLALAGCAVTAENSGSASVSQLWDAACVGDFHSQESQLYAHRELANRGLTCQQIAATKLAIMRGMPPPQPAQAYQLPTQQARPSPTPFSPGNGAPSAVGVLQTSQPAQSVSGISGWRCVYLVNGQTVTTMERGTCPSIKNFQ